MAFSLKLAAGDEARREFQLPTIRRQILRTAYTPTLKSSLVLWKPLALQITLRDAFFCPPEHNKASQEDVIGGV